MTIVLLSVLPINLLSVPILTIIFNENLVHVEPWEGF